jgi:3-isopropylmalate/(R)-2-methylmalate dehydratase large subunit
MGMTLAEKIIAGRSGRDNVKPGDLVFAEVDLALGTDVTVPLGVKVFREMGAEKVHDPSKIVFVNDHFVPAKDIKSAELSQTMRMFAREQGIEHYYEVGRSGICHVLLPEKGLIRPGDLIIGADSHTCTYGALGAFATGVGSTDMAAVWAIGENWFRVPETLKIELIGTPGDWIGGKDIILSVLGKIGPAGALYKCIEFGGETVNQLGVNERLTIANMCVEAGAKTGIFPVDGKALTYLKERGVTGVAELFPDRDACYSDVLTLDSSSLEPQVAVPYLPSDTVPVSEVGEVKLDQVVCGSCTNGRLEDMRVVAEFLKGRSVHPETRLLVIPGSEEVQMGMIKEGIAEEIIRAGGVFSFPTCGPCIGGHIGVLAPEEVGLFTSNRNFKGRCGHPTSRVYLSSPAVATASAIAGKIVDPRSFA